MTTLILTGMALAAAWVVSLYKWPFAPCRKCGGSGRNKGSNTRRHGECRRCGNKGRRARFGAKTVHRGRVSLAERRKARGK